MRVLIIGAEQIANQFISSKIASDVAIELAPSFSNEVSRPDAIIDLDFDAAPQRMAWLRSLDIPVVMVNSVVHSLDVLDPEWVRFNGWPGMLVRPIVEAAGPVEHRPVAAKIWEAFGRAVKWVPDIPGMVSARILAAIINEAFWALGEKVSTVEDIDSAMRLGTNYPYGPFEWAQQIGILNVYNLLKALAKEDPRYNPATLLQQAALA